LGIARVALPRLAAVLSAWGMLATDLRCELARTHIGDAQGITARTLTRVFAGMEREGKRRLAGSFHGAVNIHRSLDMRYGEQIFEINLPLENLDLASPAVMQEVVERSHRRHEERLNFSTPDLELMGV